MPNNISIHPISIDTAGAGDIISTPLRIRKIRWVGGTTAGHTCIIRDRNDNIFWESIASGANYVEETDFSTDLTQRSLLNGLRVTALGSGKVYIYQ